MKFIKYIAGFISIFFFLTCQKENMCDCIKRTGKIVKEERSVPHVKHLYFGRTKINCYLTNAPEFKVEVEAGENLIGLIRTEVKGDTLFITNHNKCNFSRSYKPQINVYISSPDLEGIEEWGEGTVRTMNTWTGAALSVETWSTCDIHVDVNCTEFYSHLHNSTALFVTGFAKQHSSSMWHNSTFLGENFHTISTEVLENTTGNFYCQADSSLAGYMQLSGDIIYSGSPQVYFNDLGGTGEIIKK